MPSFCLSPKTLDDLFDAILLEVGSVSQLPPQYDETMKAKLLEIMADGESWERDPEAVREQFWAIVTAMLGQSSPH
jgi:hypothetical protein